MRAMFGCIFWVGALVHRPVRVEFHPVIGAHDLVSAYRALRQGRPAVRTPIIERRWCPIFETDRAPPASPKSSAPKGDPAPHQHAPPPTTCCADSCLRACRWAPTALSAVPSVRAARHRSKFRFFMRLPPSCQRSSQLLRLLRVSWCSCGLRQGKLPLRTSSAIVSKGFGRDFGHVAHSAWQTSA